MGVADFEGCVSGKFRMSSQPLDTPGESRRSTLPRTYQERVKAALQKSAHRALADTAENLELHRSKTRTADPIKIESPLEAESGSQRGGVSRGTEIDP
jgi:hypothetical protein